MSLIRYIHWAEGRGDRGGAEIVQLCSALRDALDLLNQYAALSARRGALLDTSDMGDEQRAALRAHLADLGIELSCRLADLLNVSPARLPPRPEETLPLRPLKPQVLEWQRTHPSADQVRANCWWWHRSSSLSLIRVMRFGVTEGYVHALSDDGEPIGYQIDSDAEWAPCVPSAQPDPRPAPLTIERATRTRDAARLVAKDAAQRYVRNWIAAGKPLDELPGYLRNVDTPEWEPHEWVVNAITEAVR